MNIHLNYAYHFERDRYSWSLDLCPDRETVNVNMPEDFAPIRRQDAPPTDVLPLPQVAFHYRKTPDLSNLATTSYCLAAHYVKMLNDGLDPLVQELDYDSLPAPCAESEVTTNKTRAELFHQSYPFFIYDLQVYTTDGKNLVPRPPCLDNPTKEAMCIQRLDKLFRDYATTNNGQFLLDWSQTRRVQDAAFPIFGSRHGSCFALEQINTRYIY